MTLPPMGSGNNDRRTPPDLYAELDARFRFTLDAAASHENALAATYCTIEGTFQRVGTLPPEKASESDGLKLDWHLIRGIDRRAAVYMNPPYGRRLLEPWIQKAHRESDRGAIVVALLPVRTEQDWFHDHVIAAGATIEYLHGRVKYDGLGGAPFPSMIVIWR